MVSMEVISIWVDVRLELLLLLLYWTRSFVDVLTDIYSILLVFSSRWFTLRNLGEISIVLN
jgi:hypothetical protein